MRASLAAAMTALPLNAWLVPFVAALVAAGLAVFILLRPWAEAFHRRVALALGLTALVEAAGAALLFLPSDAVFFRQAGLSFEFLRMAAIFLAGAALIGRSSAEADPGVQRRSWIAVAVGLLGAARRVVGRLRGDRRDDGRGRARAAGAERAAAARGACCSGWCWRWRSSSRCCGRAGIRSASGSSS